MAEAQASGPQARHDGSGLGSSGQRLSDQGLFARGVSVHFEGLVALQDVDLTLRPGEILGLIGPNGAGKTTLVNVLTGFQAPTSGTVAIDGGDAKGRAPHDFARAGLGRTFQAVRLFGGMTVRQNVEMGAVGKGMALSEARAEAVRVMDWLGLSAMAELQAGTLPYGDERWVGLARALAGRPRFLLLDEPAAGSNENEAERLLQTVARIRDEFGCGVLIIEHNMQLVMSLCDRIHVLEHGRTIAEGTPAEAQADPEVRRAYLGHAAGEAAEAGAAAMGRHRTAAFAPARPLLAVEELQVSYGPVQALRGISLEVGEGEMVSVIGPNGAGKSTLMLAISGIVPPVAGRISYDGEDLAGRSAERIVRDGISMVPEGRHVFPALTVEENLIAGATPSRRRGDRNRGGDLEQVLDTFPVLRERFRSPAGKLSGGEQQQLVIARALLARPKLLLLDEPSLGLAPLVIGLVFDTLARMRDEGQTILIVEQNAARALEVSDRTYVLRSGNIVMSGPSVDLAVDPRFDEAYFGFSLQDGQPGEGAP